LNWQHSSQRQRAPPSPEEYPTEEPVLQHVIEKYIAQEYRVWQKQNNHSNLLNGAFLKIFNSIKLIHTGNTRIFEWHPRTLYTSVQLPTTILNQNICFMKIRPVDLFNLLGDMAFTFWVLFDESLKGMTIQGEFAMFQHEQGF
jgi:hypothetical protein